MLHNLLAWAGNHAAVLVVSVAIVGAGVAGVVLNSDASTPFVLPPLDVNVPSPVLVFPQIPELPPLPPPPTTTVPLVTPAPTPTTTPTVTTPTTQPPPSPPTTTPPTTTPPTTVPPPPPTQCVHDASGRNNHKQCKGKKNGLHHHHHPHAP